jgi:phosphonoacetate hydrolase
MEDTLTKLSAAALSAAALALTSLTVSPAMGAEPHPEQVVVNGKSNRWPTRPVVVILIDGNDPEYVKAGLDHGLLPNTKRLMEEGFATVARGVMPSFTDPNNVSVITGVPPSQNGISGNYYLDPATGKEVTMNEPGAWRPYSRPSRRPGRWSSP